MDEKHCILGVHITDRVKKAGEVQKILTEYGCNIKTRIGLHDVQENYCSPSGIILLEILGGDAVCSKMRSRLSAIEGVQVQAMVFEHP
jgi:hypothetical protein